MTQSLEQLREQLRKQQGGDGNNSKKSSGGDNALYKFWDAKNDTTQRQGLLLMLDVRIRIIFTWNPDFEMLIVATVSAMASFGQNLA